MKNQQGFTLFELVFALGTLAFWGLVGWVIWHFISKFW